MANHLSASLEPKKKERMFRSPFGLSLIYTAFTLILERNLLQSQDQQLGSPSSPWTPPLYQPPSPPPRRHHGPRAGRPVARIKSRATPPAGEPDDPRGPTREPRSARPVPLSPEELALPHDGPRPARPFPLSPEGSAPPHHGPRPARTFTVSPEESAPPHHGPRPARPLLLSPSQPEDPHPPRHHRPKAPRSAKPVPRATAESRSPRPRIPPPKKTNAITWSAAVCCAIFWVILILAGLIVLIVYLVYRPHSPYFDIADANLNMAYLDMGFLLNADLTIFANFTNPSKKSSVNFRYVMFELYHYNTLLASRYVDSFSVPKRMSLFVTVHLVSSQVRLSIPESQDLQKQIANGNVLLNIRGTFHARSNLGSLFRYSYWMHSHCSIALKSPPSGILRGRRCNVKR